MGVLEGVRGCVSGCVRGGLMGVLEEDRVIVVVSESKIRFGRV